MTFLLQIFEAEESDIVKAVLCAGISKLLLAGLVTDSKVRFGAFPPFVGTD